MTTLHKPTESDGIIKEVFFDGTNSDTREGSNGSSEWADSNGDC